MANLQYIGARYVPIVYTNPDDNSADWKSGVEYEPLTIVTYYGDSYTSKKAVPANIGDPASNPDYWVKTGDFNASLLSLQNRVGNIENDLGDLSGDVQNIHTYYCTPEAFGAVGDGVTDDTVAMQDAIDFAATTGIPVILSPKTYRITYTLNIPNGTILKGLGAHSSYQNNFGYAKILADFPGSGTSNVYPVLNISNSDYDKYTNLNTSTPTRTAIKIENLDIDGGTLAKSAFCGIKMQGYEININNVTISHCKIGIFKFYTFVTYIEKVNIFSCEIGIFNSYTHSNDIHRDLYVAYGSAINDNDNLSSIVINTFTGYLSQPKIMGIYCYRGKCTITDSAFEGLYFCAFLEFNSMLNADHLSIESITGVAFADESNYGPNKCISRNTYLWNPAEYATAKIAECDYRSQFIITSEREKPDHFLDATMSTRGLLIVKFNLYEQYLPISLGSVNNPTIINNRTRFEENGDLIIDFVLSDYDSVDTTPSFHVTVGTLNDGGYGAELYLPILGTTLRFNCDTQNISNISGGNVTVPKPQRFLFTVPYNPDT